MITINSAPPLNCIILDSNNTLISITSNNGVGFYFRAKISIDNILFDEQSWSRKDDFTAEKDLKKLYNAYYETIFNLVFTNGLTQQLHLIKKVSIIIEEKNIIDDSLVQSKILDDFYIMYNAKPISFTSSAKVQFLGFNPDILQIPIDGKISIPFMVNTNSETILVELKDDTGVIVDSQNIAAFTDNRVYLYNFDLATIALSPTKLYLTLIITVGPTALTKVFRIFKYPKFQIKQITFLNNFGFWIYTYLDGQLSIDNNLDVKVYEELDNTEKVYEINEMQNYTISTGALLTSEKDIVNQIVTALAAKIFLNSEYISMINATKKINQYKDQNNLYAENLIFSVKQDLSINNIYTNPNPIGSKYSNNYNNNYKK